MGFDLTGGRPEDRLVTAIFIASLLHGLVIMGLRFTAPSPDRRPLPTLEVLLVPEGPAEPDNESAAYLSTRDQRGAGTSRERQRTSLPEASASLLEHSGDPQGTEPSPAASDSSRGGSPVLAAASPRSRSAVTGDELEPDVRAALPLESRPLPQVGVNASAASESLHLQGDPSVDDRLFADTRESQIASYLDGWKRRVEQVGTAHFPEAARSRSAAGSPVLEVAIRADGSLQQVMVRRSSGRRELDNAAIRTVRLAAPFDPFPPAMRERYPELRFAYEWQFMTGRGSVSAYRPDAP